VFLGLLSQLSTQNVALVAEGRSGGGIGGDDAEEFVDQGDPLVYVLGGGHIIDNCEAWILGSIRITFGILR